MGVTEELEDISVKNICSGLGNDVDDAAGEAAILSIDIARQNAELGDGVEIRDDSGLLPNRLLHTRAV